MKKILAALLVLIMLVGAVGCSSDKAPEGYMLVSLEDEIFNLYVPKTWQNNASSGISSAYYAQGSGIIVSATSQRSGVLGVELSDYINAVLDSYESTLVDYEQVTEPKSTTLDSFAAYTFDYKAKVADKTVLFRCVIAKNENMFTTLTYCAPEEEFESLLSDFEGIVDAFRFRKFEVETDEPFIFKDEHTPDGFKMASGSKYEFRFFVPESWDVDVRAAIPSACYSATELSNVSLNSFLVMENIKNGKQYWEAFKESYDYELTEISRNENAKMGGFDAFEVEYVSKIADFEYHIKQVFITTSNMIYIFTYTSDAENYALHMDDVNSMIEVFEFKK